MLDEAALLVVAGVDGKLVFEQMISKGQGHLAWNSETLSAGMYMIQVRSLSGKLLAKQKVMVTPKR
jgi:hypothetical protein